MTTTDTPRTDGLWANGNTGEDELDALCRQLERELSATRKLAIELVQELISKCDDQIHKEQLIELTK